MNVARVAVLTVAFLSASHLPAQEAPPPAQEVAPSDDAAWSNDCLALAYRLPDGWKFGRVAPAKAGQSAKASMVLFRARRDPAAGPKESIELNLMGPPLQHPNMERFTILMALTFTQTSANRVTRNAYAVKVAGRSFYRTDFSSGEKAVALLTTWYRGYAVLAWVFASSPDDLDVAVTALDALKFGEDKRTAECIVPAN
jgi:hypothetical protein